MAAWVAALLAVTAPGWWTPASAHGDFETGSPGPGDEIVAGNTAVWLEFVAIDPDAPAFVALIDEEGDPVAVGETSAASDTVVCARSAPLESGVYDLEYLVTSDDGHLIRGTYAFEVLDDATPDTRTDPCSATDVADPGEALTMAEMSSGDGLPAWAIPVLGVLLLAAGAAVVVRIRRDRSAADG